MPQDLRLPERSPLPFPTRLRDSQAPEPGPDREEAGRPPKSAPSYKWEAVAVTQVSRGPSARRERARAAPLSAVAIMKKEKPRAAPQAAFAAARRAQLSASRPRGLQSVQTPHPAVSADPGRMGWVPSRWLPFFFFFLQRLPTCQLMDLITHSGACSSAAARSIHAAPPQPACGRWLPEPRGWGAQTSAATRPQGPAPLSPWPRVARGALQIVLCLHAIPYSAEGGRGSAEFSPAVSRLETDI